MKRIFRYIIVLSVALLMVGCFGGGNKDKGDKKGAGFKTIEEVDKEIVDSGKPIYYQLSHFVKSNFFRLEVNRVIMFDDKTQIELYAENANWHKISRDFYSYLDNRDEGFYIKIGEDVYKSTSVNGKYTYSVNGLDLAEKRLLVVDFEPIPRETKSFSLMTGRDKGSYFPNRVNILLNKLGRPKYLESGFISDWAGREAIYKRVEPLVYDTKFEYDDDYNEVKYRVTSVTIGYSHTYVDLEIENYSQRIDFSQSLGSGALGSLNISVPNRITKAPLMKVHNNGKTDNTAARVKVSAQSTLKCRLEFNTIPREARRIVLGGVLANHKGEFNVQLKEEL